MSVTTAKQIPSLRSFISTNTASPLSSLIVSSDVVFSLDGDSKNNLFAKMALQVVLLLWMRVHEHNSYAKTVSYYSHLGFLGSVTSGIQTQMNN